MVRPPRPRRGLPLRRVDAPRRRSLRSQWSVSGRNRVARPAPTSTASLMSPRYVWWLAAAVIALQVPYPLVHGHARNTLTIATVIVFAVASVAHGRASGGGQRVAALCAVGVVGFGAEVLGVHTGVPFGDYRYTGGLGPTLASVPLVIALAWLMMAQPAACVAARLTHDRLRRVVIAA